MNDSSSRIAASSLLMLLVFPIGCTSSDGTQPASPGPAQRATKDTAEDAPPAASPEVKQVSVRVIDEDDLAEVLADYRGKVVLIDFWATWCLACIELFPHTVALHDRFAENGLAVISVSFDQPESRQVALDFLKKQRATFDNFISRYGAGVESAERFGLPGSLPQLLLFDRQGELAHTFPAPQSGVNTEQVDQAVKELLGIAR